MLLKNGDKEDDIMHTKTMEGLIGARVNVELLNTPFRVYKEARLKGDTAKMEQAMGYMSEFNEDAYEYKKEADEGMKEDAEENRKIAEEQLEEIIQNRKEEREQLEEKMAEKKDDDTIIDTVEISEEGKALLEDHGDWDSPGSAEIMVDTLKEPVTYTKEGEAASMEKETRISVSV